MELVRGGVYFARLPYVEDPKAVLIVSWNAINAGMRSPIVCQVTRTDRPRTLPTYVFLEAGEGGLPDESYVLCHALTTLEADDFLRQLGEVSPAAMLNVEAALRRTLELP